MSQSSPNTGLVRVEPHDQVVTNISPAKKTLSNNKNQLYNDNDRDS